MNILESLSKGLETKYFGNTLDEAVYGGQKWSNLSDEERQKCLNADPTYNGKEDSAGKYSEWILKIYSNFKKYYPNEEFRFEHCKDALTQFMRSKENLRDESKRDINRFGSLSELDDFLNNSQNFKNTFVEVPKEESSIEGAKKIFENNRCEIWVPLTHEASVALAGEPKTKWCTAYSSPYQYNDYTKEGPLFILIMKDNSGEMYQFHFERKTAMDKYDHWVKWEDFPEMQSQEVKNFRKEYFKEADETICRQLDSLLDEKTHVSNFQGVQKVADLMGRIHDENLAFKYDEPLNNECLEQFYTNLTYTPHTLDMDSLSLRYLRMCVGKVDIMLPDSVTRIKSICFRDCESLRSIFIPNSVTSIGECAFANCHSLESIAIPDSVTSIGRCTFLQCLSLKSIVIPDSVTSIGEEAFFGCSSLESIMIPNRVTSIEGATFFKCSSLESIVIPSSITSIENKAFCKCTSLKDIYYSGSQEDREKIRVGEDNDNLLNATWHYNWKNNNLK